jgi:hypothetical protein
MKLKTTDRTDFNTYMCSSYNTKHQQQEFLKARRKDGQTKHACEVLETANCGLTLNVQTWIFSTRLCVCVCVCWGRGGLQKLYRPWFILGKVPRSNYEEASTALLFLRFYCHLKRYENLDAYQNTSCLSPLHVFHRLARPGPRRYTVCVWDLERLFVIKWHLNFNRKARWGDTT